MSKTIQSCYHSENKTIVFIGRNHLMIDGWKRKILHDLDSEKIPYCCITFDSKSENDYMDNKRYTEMLKDGIPVATYLLEFYNDLKYLFTKDK